MDIERTRNRKRNIGKAVTRRMIRMTCPAERSRWEQRIKQLEEAGDAMKAKWLQFSRSEVGSTEAGLAGMDMGDACDTWDAAKAKTQEQHGKAE